MNEHEHVRLLLDIVRGRWDQAEARVRRGSVAADRFVEVCRQADVPSWVHARLSEAGRLDLIGAGAAERLAEIRARVRNDNLLLMARAEQAVAALQDAGVTPVALKGLDLLYRIYESFDERTLDDVDLLVRREELGDCIRALEEQGWEAPPEPKRTHYIRSSHHLPMSSPGPVRVDFEIHWGLAQEMRYRIDEQGLHERAVPLEIEGRTVLRMDDHDLVAHLLLHHFTHYFDRRLKWAIDMQRISRLPGFDWKGVVRRLREWGATAASGMSLVHVRRSVPEWIPEEALRALRPAAWRRALLWPLRSPHPLDLLRGTRRRAVQLYVAAVLLEDPFLLPRWLAHRATRDRRTSTHPLDREGDRAEVR